MVRLRPRDYQVEAARWALRKGRAVVCMPTGTGKTLIAAIWIEELLRSGRARKVLVLEPTRFMVEQTAEYLRREGIESLPVHGSLPKVLRRRNWGARVVVATPEAVVAEWERFVAERFDAVVIDECHHTTGKDAYRYVATNWGFRWRLGLTPLVPRSRRAEIEEAIGEIRCWGWEDPRIVRYLPAWSAEVYEAPLNEVEESIYRELEDFWSQYGGSEKAAIGNAIRWFVRDGALALKESLRRGGRLSRILAWVLPRLESSRVRDAHKLGALERALTDHEGFTKALVFIERVSVAAYVAAALRASGWGVAELYGRRWVNPAEALQAARSARTEVVVATSAGEEGIDMPEADLLVVWSNTASPIRFVQRLGRVLRSAGVIRGQRYVVFIVTPDTVDVDSLIDGLVEAGRAGVAVSVDPEVVRYVWSISRRRRFLDVISESPAPPDVVAAAVGAPRERAEEALKWLATRGFAVYIHTPYGRVYASRDSIDKLYGAYAEWLSPSQELVGKAVAMIRKRRVASAEGTYQQVRRRLAHALSRAGYFTELRFSTQVMIAPGLARLVNLTYSFIMDSEDILDLVLRNAYSAESILSKKE